MVSYNVLTLTDPAQPSQVVVPPEGSDSHCGTPKWQAPKAQHSQKGVTQQHSRMAVAQTRSTLGWQHSQKGSNTAFQFPKLSTPKQPWAVVPKDCSNLECKYPKLNIIGIWDLGIQGFHWAPFLTNSNPDLGIKLMMSFE